MTLRCWHEGIVIRSGWKNILQERDAHAKVYYMVAHVNDIVSRVVHPEAGDLPAVTAHKFLSWQFSDKDRERVAELLEKKREATLSQAEANELHTYTVFGDLLNILHAQARLSLQQTTSTPRTA